MNDANTKASGGPATADRPEPALEVRNMHKHFGAVIALDGIDFEVPQGEIVGLVGDNGAGKSTLIKILSGAQQPTEGEVFIEGRKVSFASPRDAQEYGIETVYQDLALFDDLSVAANMFVGREKRNRYGLLDHRGMGRFTKDVVQRLNVNVPDTRATVRNLSGGQRQAVAVARSVAFGSKVVLLDEPTSALSTQAAEHVLDIIRDLRKHGVSAIFVAHNMEHVQAVCDRIYVLRRGLVAGIIPKEDFSTHRIVAMMLGGTKDDRED